MKRIVDGAYLLELGTANAVLLADGKELVLVDAGFPGKLPIVLDAIRTLGRRPEDLRHLVFTHHHPDHIGSAAAIVRETGATTWMHALDAPIAATGGPFRPMTRAPGLWPRIAFPLFWHPNERVEPIRIDRLITDGELLEIGGGLRAVHTPGHCAGHLSFLWRGAQLLIVGDVAMNLFGLSDPIGFEGFGEGRASQAKIAALRFEAAAFGHGRPIRSGASARLARAFGSRPAPR